MHYKSLSQVIKRLYKTTLFETKDCDPFFLLGFLFFIKMSKRLEILKSSLIKKEQLFNEKINIHIQTVKLSNGQPLNDKRNGQKTLAFWEKQNDSIRNVQKQIEVTKRAIEKEEYKIKHVESVQDEIPLQILELVKDGKLTQWRKFPNMFFVVGVDKGRIIWENKKRLLFHKYYNSISDSEQKKIFAEIYNSLSKILNNGK